MSDSHHCTAIGLPGVYDDDETNNDRHSSSLLLPSTASEPQKMTTVIDVFKAVICYPLPAAVITLRDAPSINRETLPDRQNDINNPGQQITWFLLRQ